MKKPSQRFCVTFTALLGSALLAVPARTAFAQTTNQILSLDGNGSYVTVPNSPDLYLSNFTLEAWVNAASTNSGEHAVIAKQYSIYRTGYRLGLSGNTPDLGADDGSNPTVTVSTQVIDAGTWHHLCGTYDGSVFRVYVDGFLSGSQVSTIQLQSSSFPLYLGQEPVNGQTRYFSGMVDEVRIWNTARSPDEINATRFCRLTGTETNLVAYWTFDDGTARDLTGHGHNGTFSGHAQVISIQGTDAVHAGNCGALLPRTATASAIVTNGFVIGATLTDGGLGYTNTPTVRIIGGGGSGAQAVTVVSNGVVIAVNVMAAGVGYTNAPVIVIEPPFIEPPTMSIAAMSLLSFTNLAVGTNYQLQSLVGDTWSNVGAAFTAAGSTFTQYIAGTTSANSYRLAATPVPTQAYATAQLDNGFVVGATVTSGGSGYTTSPAVSITGGGGSNATAIATVSGGAVTKITITSAGIGYINTPAIIIAPPPANALWPMVTQAMELDLGQLSPYDNYQLEFKPVLGAAWSNLGSTFTPTSTTNTQYVNVSGNGGFFRAMYVP